MSRLTTLLCIAFLTALLAACAQAAASTSGAIGDCESHRAEVAKRWGPVQSVSGAFAVSALDVVRWQETRDAAQGIRPVSPLRRLNIPDAAPLLVCFYDGDFDHFPGRGTRPPFDRISVIIEATGRYTLDTAGPRRYFKVERPGQR